MQEFTEEHSKSLLGKEWLVRTDNQTSTPYLFKFCSSTVDLSCCLLLTDTKSVWAEVLNSNQLARRWRDNQPVSAPPFAEGEEEEAWRATVLELLSKGHTIGGIAETSFNITQSNYSDLAFELEWYSFKWRWETSFLGYKTSADTISKHLILPFISVAHLAFSSPDAISAMSDADAEKAIDKVGRTARRTVDTHIKGAISKPRLASTIRRMTAMFNFISDLPPVISNTEKAELTLEVPASKIVPHSHILHNTLPSISPKSRVLSPAMSVEPTGLNELQDHEDSATESEGDEFTSLDKGSVPRARPSNLKVETPSRDSSRPRVSPIPSTSKQGSDSGSSPVRPPKKPRLKNPVESSSSADEDSEAERKRRVASLKSGNAAAAGLKRGTKQPIKRGGKRF